jgi:biotin carboxyl carrier protein
MKLIKLNLAIYFSIFIISCNNSENNGDEASQDTTPVTVTGVDNTSISENIKISAVSAYQKKNLVKSNINGYIVKSFVNIGDFVPAGKLLFTLKTKEAAALSNYNKNDSTLTFKGETRITSPSTGIITEVSKLTDDYVADGDQLCVIAEQNSFVFLLNVPFEQTKYVSIGSKCNLLLPDSSYVQGIITSKLSSVDAISQTQSFVIRPQTNKILPENLLAIVQITQKAKTNAQVIDNKCVLTDEIMENFWVMKLINDTTAVRVNIKKGITTDFKTEILSPQFNKTDRIISSGNYGLPDTAYVNIIQN